MNRFIPVNEPLLNGNEKKYLNECIDTGWISSEGRFIKKLEEDFSTYCHQKYGITVANGSVALDVAVRALKEKHNWQDNDEIIVPTFTLISSAQSVIYNKLKPIFVDCESVTWNMDTSKIEPAITTRTKAIMVVHIYGLPTDMQPIFDLAKKYDLKIIEDSAQAHGQTYFNKKCGGMGDISTFSFYANKHIAAGEGGMILTSDKDLFEKCNYFKNLCFQPEQRYVHNDLGWNFRMSNIQAAVGVAQFERLEQSIKIKKQMGKKYRELLSQIPAQLPMPKMDYAENHYWVFGIVLNDDVKFNAQVAREKLQQNGVGTRPFFYPMHQQPVLIRLKLSDKEYRPVSERLYDRGFYIPSGLGLDDEQIEKVVKEIRRLF
ncbi:MAG: DegT/DnrJ/EryC1/StrS family aminotransferase [Holosporaceae bacterium]|jgi:perosamine synthetase|nr:DegT/DnrJ/EryC1/StrS family aminotransferase [Holosporaceae bacterium]